jgi:hypothetical protein
LVYPLSVEDRNSEVVAEKKRQFETRLTDSLGSRMKAMNFAFVRYVDDEPVQIREPDDIDDLGPETDAFDKLYFRQSPATVRGRHVVLYRPSSKTRCK